MYRINIFTILLTLSAIVNIVLCTTTQSKYYYVDPSSTCTYSCGSSQSPFSNIKDAINYALDKNSAWSSPTIMLKPGLYKKSNNKDILIDESIEIRSVLGALNTTIDCEFTSGAFQVIKAKQVTIQGVTIKNCRSTYGGAIYAEDTPISIKDSIFDSNSARFGGAIYSSKRSLSVSSTIFRNNSALVKGGAIQTSYSQGYFSKSVQFQCNMAGPQSGIQKNDVYCDHSSIKLDKTVNMTNVAVTCTKHCSIEADWDCQKSFCNNPFNPKSCPLKGGNSTNGGGEEGSISCSLYDNVIGLPSNSSICNPITDSCLSAPSKCSSCYFSGVAMEYYKGANISSLQLQYVSNTKLDITDFMPEVKAPGSVVKGVFKGYLKVPNTAYYKVSIVGGYIGAEFLIDNVLVLNASFHQPKLNSTDLIYLEADKVHRMKGSLLSYEQSESRSLKVTMIDTITNNVIDPFFYSKNTCGDGIYDKGEEDTCPGDVATIDPYTGTPLRLCQQQDPNLDFFNCHSLLTKTCPTRITAKNHLSPGYYFVENDMLGNLISNQYLFHLPGSEHMSYGMDIITGKEGSAPLFYFSYCDSKATTIVEDVYRGRTYDIPKELFAKPLPECKFSTQSSTSKDAQELAQKMQTDTSQAYGASIGAGPAAFKVEASVAFSKEKSVEKASELKTSSTETIISTELYCTTSLIEMNDNYQLHPLFLQSLSQVTTELQMVDLIEVYGTHFYKKATMGGKLVQLTVTSEMTSSQESIDNWKESATRTFSIGVNSNVFQAQGSYSDTIDSSLDSKTQKEMESKSKRSSIITYGGPLGAYSPSKDYSSSNFEKWAQGVDLLPVPVSYDLYPILEAINPLWKVKDTNITLRELWIKGIEIYYSRFGFGVEGDDTNEQFSMIFNYKSTAPFLPILTVDWTLNDTATNSIVPVNTQVVIPFTYVDGTGKVVVNNYLHKADKLSGESLETNRIEWTDLAKLDQDWEEAPNKWKMCELGGPKEFCFKNTYKMSNVGGINRDVPHVFHFKTQNFFTSFKEPKFTLNLNKDDILGPVHIISWKSKQSVLLNYDGSLYNNEAFDMIYSYTRLYGDRPATNLQRDYRDDKPPPCKIPMVGCQPDANWLNEFNQNGGEGYILDCLDGRSFTECTKTFANSDPDLMYCCFPYFHYKFYENTLGNIDGYVKPNDNLRFGHSSIWTSQSHPFTQSNNKYYLWGRMSGKDDFSKSISGQHRLAWGSKTKLRWAIKSTANITDGWKREIHIFSDKITPNKYSSFPRINPGPNGPFSFIDNQRNMYLYYENQALQLVMSYTTDRLVPLREYESVNKDFFYFHNYLTQYNIDLSSLPANITEV